MVSTLLQLWWTCSPWDRWEGRKTPHMPGTYLPALFPYQPDLPHILLLPTMTFLSLHLYTPPDITTRGRLPHYHSNIFLSYTLPSCLHTLSPIKGTACMLLPRHPFALLPTPSGHRNRLVTGTTTGRWASTLALRR